MTSNSSPDSLTAERILLITGVTYVFLAMVLGIFFAFVVSHVANAGIKEAWTAVMSAVSAGDSAAVREHFATIADMSAMRGRMMNSHSHLGACGLLALVMAVVLPLTSLSAGTKRLLAWSVVGGAILQFTGVVCAYYVDYQAIYLADLGALVLFAGVAMALVGLLRNDNAGTTLPAFIESRTGSSSSRFLLKAGVALLLVGMLLGMYLAWLIVSGEEAQTLAGVAQSVELLMKNDVEAAQAAIGAFKFGQAKSAINAASHSHGPVLALFMLLLAFLRPMINLREKFFRFYCMAFAALSFALPLWIFLAINVWFNFRFFANYTGILLACLTLVLVYGAISGGAKSDDLAREAG